MDFMDPKGSDSDSECIESLVEDTCVVHNIDFEEELDDTRAERYTIIYDKIRWIESLRPVFSAHPSVEKVWDAYAKVLLETWPQKLDSYQAACFDLLERTYGYESTTTDEENGPGASYFQALRIPVQRYLSCLVDDYVSAVSCGAISSLDDMYTLLRQRQEAGLLRNGQVRLIVTFLEGAIVELERSMEKYPERVTVMIMHRWFISNLLCSPRLRSERLEVLIEKYLQEDGVNMEVVDYIVAATKAEIQQNEWLRLRLRIRTGRMG
ncbi:hypothetical protein BJ508DRAFT_150547 [Ascobolus immersus RN42]|uniref:Uncharacterized protein n=1 Tax=Ascobolus immersus RN42 TaxID=1160509 RepID=A0A3N4I3X7_ASCIM|nr:hypothetical protein BJ508DRAFT_150547 [Ascobolus immersus RN42]